MTLRSIITGYFNRKSEAKQHAEKALLAEKILKKIDVSYKTIESLNPDRTPSIEVILEDNVCAVSPTEAVFLSGRQKDPQAIHLVGRGANETEALADLADQLTQDGTIIFTMGTWDVLARGYTQQLDGSFLHTHQASGKGYAAEPKREVSNSTERCQLLR